ncbi:homeobox-leucine zipper protein HOX3-like [Asparagus officinalis]|uniref:homeobox-leucine zipper protein HOX3-like n=1 Tax=Asparagus officinalis TaxID=4686 RepID=UPI00098E592A|nr:homeobox-leucine zipper protein HOX3-like [Asparagus officinalis]
MGGFGISPLGLELTMAVPGSMSSSSVSEGVGYNITRDLDINLPASEEMVEVDDDDVDGSHRSKKLRLSKEQSRLLEESFRQNHTLNPTQKEALASRLRLKPRQVEVWFQNRRARTKLKQTEMECEYLKRCFGSLSQENKRLQREVEELRAMRVTPPTILSPQTRLPIPASALTMCPRCQRVTTAAPSAQNRRDGRRPLARGYIVVEC